MKTAQQQAQDLAVSMGVSVADVMMLAQSAANSMKKDKADKAFFAADSSLQTELAMVYAEHAVKKFTKFHNAYLTKPQLKQNVDESVLALLQH